MRRGEVKEEVVGLGLGWRGGEKKRKEIKENIWQGDLQLWRNVPLLLEQKQQQ